MADVTITEDIEDFEHKARIRGDMMKDFTLLDLSNELIAIGFPDMFNWAIDGEVLVIDEMKGSWADMEGDVIVDFDIIELSMDDGYLGTKVRLTNYESIEEVAIDMKLRVWRL